MFRVPQVALSVAVWTALFVLDLGHGLRARDSDSGCDPTFDDFGSEEASYFIGDDSPGP